MVALGRARQAKGREYYSGDINLPSFLTVKNLRLFVPEELFKTSAQIEFRTLRGKKAFGYSADLLPKDSNTGEAANQHQGAVGDVFLILGQCLAVIRQNT